MSLRPRAPKSLRRTARFAGAIGFVAVLAFGARPVWHVTHAALTGRDRPDAVPVGYADDASRLNRTRVAEVFEVPTDSALAEAQLVALVDRARRAGLHVSIAGARHSMGGHTISRDGVVIDMSRFRGMSLSSDSSRLHVRAGTTWADVLPFLDTYGRSVAVMQSNNSFTVGGSLSANVHGWQTGRPPIASTVVSFRLLMADGRILRCSRDENHDLFRLVLGGYGLFGVILDAELATVPNEVYRAERIATSGVRYASLFDQRVAQDTTVGMAYGRVSVAPDGFLREAMMTVLHRTGSPVADATPLPEPSLLGLKRAVFRGSVGSAYGKTLRWRLEKWFGDLPGTSTGSRNQLLDVPVNYFTDTSPSSTDVLHEYFVPRARLEEFLTRARAIIPAHRADLLNVTIRDVLPDSDSFLPYAREPVFGVVMYFNQERTLAADDSMRALTRELVDAALALGGTYYLPYRLHATQAQFERAYPMAQQFFALKRRYDPAGLFRNSFYEAYGGQ